MKKMILSIIIGNKVFNIMGGVLLTALFFSMKYPYIVTFKNKYQYENITIYSDIVLKSPQETLGMSLALIKTSHFYKRDMKFVVFICESYSKYKLFNPLGKGSFAKYYPLISRIFINKVDNEKLVHRILDKRTRKLSNVIAHEATHLMLYKSLSLDRYLRLPSWVHEGYADFVAQSSTLSKEEALKLQSSNSNNKSLLYFYYKKRVVEAINIHGSIEKLIESHFSK